jgi:hypothetical protein
MTINEIKAELRNVACSGANPIIHCSQETWRFLIVNKFRDIDSCLGTTNDWRIFFLLVAEAL